jgi:hypothetical protein
MAKILLRPNAPIMERCAVWALTAPITPKKPNKCQMWTRLAWQHGFGARFDFAWKETAVLAAIEWEKSKWCVPLENGSTIGDILYWKSGNNGFGHVGIRISNNLVAQNSSMLWNGRDARGVRDIRHMRDYDVIVRLPREA